MKKIAKVAVLAVILCGVVLSFASCSFFTPSFEEMCESLADENYLCAYSYGEEETKDYDETFESKYGCELKGEILARAEYTSGTTFIRLYKFEKRSDAMTAQSELMESFTNGGASYGGSLYRYYYVVDGILLETSSTSAAKAALDDAYVLVDLPNATTEDIMDYFTGLFD